jgi:hypothetical protein
VPHLTIFRSRRAISHKFTNAQCRIATILRRGHCKLVTAISSFFLPFFPINLFRCPLDLFVLSPLVLSKFERILVLRKYRQIFGFSVFLPLPLTSSKVPRSVFLGRIFSASTRHLWERRATGTMAPCPTTGWVYPTKPACLVANAKDLQVSACCHLCSCGSADSFVSARERWCAHDDTLYAFLLLLAAVMHPWAGRCCLCTANTCRVLPRLRWPRVFVGGAQGERPWVASVR